MDLYNIKQFLDDNLKLIFGRFVDIDIFLGKYRYMSVEKLLKKCEDFANQDCQKQFYLASAALVEKVMDNITIQNCKLKEENETLKLENIRLQQENLDMKLHIQLSPGGDIYLQAQQEFYNIASQKN